MTTKLVNTQTAARETGLSAYELRRGAKTGRYPALVIGGGSERSRLRWNLEKLLASIDAQSESRCGVGQ